MLLYDWWMLFWESIVQNLHVLIYIFMQYEIIYLLDILEVVTLFVCTHLNGSFIFYKGCLKKVFSLSPLTKHHHQIIDKFVFHV